MIDFEIVTTATACVVVVDHSAPAICKNFNLF